MKPKMIDRLITVAGIAGILLSTYTMYVEMAIESNPRYKALCDISEYASCSSVVTSKFSQGFGLVSDESTLKVPNCIYGIVFYCLVIFLSTFDQLLVVYLLLATSLSSILVSVYLAYLLMFVLHNFCIVCVSTYIVNGFLVALVYQKLNALTTKNK